MYPYNTPLSIQNFKQLKNSNFKTHPTKLSLDVRTKDISRFLNKKILNRINQRLIPFFYLKYRIYLSNAATTGLRPTTLNSVRNITIVTKKNNRLDLTCTAQQLLSTLTALQQSHWVS